MSNIDLSIIIPAYRESGVIGDSLERLAQAVKTGKYGAVEIVVVVPDSPDQTAEIAKSKASLFEYIKVVRAGKRVGKGRDVRIGMFEASGRYKLFMDADLATPLKHLDDVQAFIERGGQIGIAVRSLWSIHKGLVRKIISKCSNIAAQILITPGIKDTQCGFKVFEASVADEVFGRQTMLSWSFDAELLAIARKLHYKIEFFKADDWKDPKAEGLGLVGDNPVKAAIRGLLDLFVIRINLWTGKYKHKTYEYAKSIS
jgi:dolichyl-phosphate beta-glucosyltransferase